MQQLPLNNERAACFPFQSLGALNEEDQSDRQLREQFKERWTRTPSDKLTQPIRAEGAKYKTIIDNAIQADHVVKERYNKHRSAIELLSKSNVRSDEGLLSVGSVFPRHYVFCLLRRKREVSNFRSNGSGWATQKWLLMCAVFC